MELSETRDFIPLLDHGFVRLVDHMEPDFTKYWVATVVQHHHRMEKLLAPESRAPHPG